MPLMRLRLNWKSTRVVRVYRCMASVAAGVAESVL